MCTFACSKARTFATDRCTYAQRDCMNGMQTQAIRDYEAYAKDQLKAKAPLDLFPRDFERPEKCAPVDCVADAEQEYRACYKSCGGRVEIE